MTRKVIDKKDIIEDILNNIAPNYFTPNINKNRVGTFGYITETQATSIADTIILNRQRSQDYVVELSDNEMILRQVAKIRGNEIYEATAATTTMMLMVKHSDILERGDRVGSEYQFKLDKRSTILNNGVNYSLENDILIRAITINNEIIFTANYTGDQSQFSSLIQTFDMNTEDGAPAVGLLVNASQYRYNIIEKIVTDELEFTYDGIEFEYSDKLCGFDVYYKSSTSPNYIKLEKEYYLSDTKSSTAIYYNDDTKGSIFIVNNPLLNIKENYQILVELKETLGADGVRTIGEGATTFDIFKDDAYNYAGVNISCEILTDSKGGKDGDNLEDIRTKLINAKFERKNITTDHDIKTYVNDPKANLQIIKKRNDMVDRTYNIYSLLNINGVVSPTRTVNLKLYESDFDVVHNISNRRILRANNTFTISNDVAIKQAIAAGDIPAFEADKEKLCLNMPFMMAISDDLIASYYFNTIKSNHILKFKYINDRFAYQLVSREMTIQRNALDAANYNKYTVTVKAMLNTSNDLDIVDDQGNIIDAARIKSFALFRTDSDITSYLPLTMTSFDRTTRMFTFTGSFDTNDYITETEKLQITGGLLTSHDTVSYDGVIDYKKICIDIAFLYKSTPESTSNEVYSIIPGITDYTLCNQFDNSNDLSDLLLEFNKFMRSTIKVEEEIVGEITTQFYTIKEVPFIKYSYSKANIFDIYNEIDRLRILYTEMIRVLSDFTINLKFISTYGKSKFIKIGETNTDLANLNPIIKFRIYGKNINIDEIKTFIHNQFMNSYIDDTYMFISNINTNVEQTYNVKSCEFLGIDNFNSLYQKITYTKPDLNNKTERLAYVPEYLNIGNITIEVVEL